MELSETKKVLATALFVLGIAFPFQHFLNGYGEITATTAALLILWSSLLMIYSWAISGEDESAKTTRVDSTHNNPRPPTSSTPSRMYFLDNVKVFLTISVVSFHIACAFGACKGMWTHAIADYGNKLGGGDVASLLQRGFLMTFTAFNQSYFMPLFFFISGYFSPTSYDRKQRVAFLKDKMKRLFIPATFVAFVLTPAAFFVAQLNSGNKLSYTAIPGQGWFLLWLLIFNYVYSECREAEAKQSVQKIELQMEFPNTWTRLGYGRAIGYATLILIGVMGHGSYLLTMPVTIGSVFMDIVMFMAGTIAKRNEWISVEEPISKKLDMPVGVFRFATALLVLFCIALLDIGNKFTLILHVCVSGLVCVEMAVAVLEFFQTNMNFETPFTKFMADAAYTVFLIHVVVIITLTAIYTRVYNTIFGEIIVFDCGLSSCSRLVGLDDGGLHILIGFIVMNVVVHGTLWPLAHYIAHRPMFQDYLL